MSWIALVSLLVALFMSSQMTTARPPPLPPLPSSQDSGRPRPAAPSSTQRTSPTQSTSNSSQIMMALSPPPPPPPPLPSSRDSGRPRPAAPSSTQRTSPTQSLISGDLLVQYYNRTISTRKLLTELNMTHNPFNVTNICPSLNYSCETVCPLNDSDEARERTLQKPCYCDKLCLELGDCCFDYFASYSCNGSGFIEIDLNSITVLSNGSLWIPQHKGTYNNGTYFVNGSVAFVCMNLTRNFTETTTLVSKDATLKIRQMMTCVGSAISMVSLILLLGVYVTIAELRTLPGKNLMSLSSSMLLYHSFYLMNSQTNHPAFCTVVSFLLHYFLLSSFCWMSVMAFDVGKTFGRNGSKIGQTSRMARSGARKAALIKYHIFAWTSPAVIVVTSFVLDTTHAVHIGYGK